MTHPSQPPSRRRHLAVLPFLAVLLTAVPFAHALNPTKSLREYGRQTWQSDTGLPQNTVHAILQTRDGFLWLATEGGLVRFDGADFLTFTTPQLPTNSIAALAEDTGPTSDSAQTLWISTPEGLLSLPEGQSTFTLYTTANGLPANNVRAVYPRPGGLLALTSAGPAILHDGRFQPIPTLKADLTPANLTEDAHHTLWIAANHQLFTLLPNATTPSLSPITIPSAIGTIQAIAAAPGNTLWIGGHEGLARLTPNSPPLILHTASVTALQPEPDGTLWIGTDTGLSRYANSTLRPVPTTPGTPILKLFQDRNGSLWIASDRGVTRLSPNSSQPTPQTPIPDVLTLFEDREGDLWFGTDTDGLTLLRDQPVSTLTTADGLSDDFVRSLFEDHAHTLWIGTSRGGLNALRNGAITPLDAQLHGQHLSSSVVLALAETRVPISSPSSAEPTSTLWIGTPDGLARLYNNHLQLFTTADGLPDDFVRSLYADTDNSLWIGTRNGLAHYQNGTFTSFSSLDGLGSDVIGAILRSHDGTLWVGTLGGLSRLTGKDSQASFVNSTTHNGLAGDAITALHEDSSGTLWIAAHSSGLTRLRNGVFAPIPAATLPEEIFSILESPAEASSESPVEASLWLGSSHGIDRVSLASLNAFADKKALSLPTTLYTTADGMTISECSSGGHPAAWRLHDGSLAFATLKGVASIQPNALATPLLPLTAIEQLLIDDTPTSITPGSTLTIPPNIERLALHYAGLSFASPQRLRFRYKLEGFDRDWIDAGSRRTAFYTNLPPGNYRFLVASSNTAGQWSEPAQLLFHLKPRFYQTLWFYALLLIATAILAWLLYRARVRIVEARYRAVLDERTRIAREIHDTLAQGYVGVSVQLELTSRLLKSSPDAALTQLELTKDLVRASLADARSSIWNLRTPQPTDAPDTLPHRLATTLESRRKSTSESSEGSSSNSPTPTLRLDVHGTYRPLSPRIEDELHRIAQESLANALRHAHATRITLTLTYTPDSLRLAIADDGLGFTPPPGGFTSTGHFGLKGLEERAAAIHAQLRITSRPGEGTTVEATLPLNSTHDVSS